MFYEDSKSKLTYCVTPDRNWNRPNCPRTHYILPRRFPLPGQKHARHRKCIFKRW